MFDDCVNCVSTGEAIIYALIALIVVGLIKLADWYSEVD